MTMSQEEFQQYYQDSVDRLKQANIRMTPQRKAILSYMIKSKSHPTIDEIYHDLMDDDFEMSLATVYNNLNTLVELGLVEEMKFSDITSRYDFLDRNHQHILCTECGKIGDFVFDDVSAINQAARDQTGYLVNQTRLELYGICPECRKKQVSDQ
ncbi:Fur family transcriptional regulator [Hutsoniella sourekii]